MDTSIIQALITAGWHDRDNGNDYNPPWNRDLCHWYQIGWRSHDSAEWSEYTETLDEILQHSILTGFKL